MRAIKLPPKDIQQLSISLKKIIGQLQSLSDQINEKSINDQTFVQLLAAKGGISRVCKDIISKGILSNLNEYSTEELDNALNIILKL